jgi:hypothetical protein
LCHMAKYEEVASAQHDASDDVCYLNNY